MTRERPDSPRLAGENQTPPASRGLCELIPPGEIDDAFEGSPHRPGGEVAGEALGGAIRLVDDLAGIMGTEDDLRQGPKRMFGRQRLGGEHI